MLIWGLAGALWLSLTLLPIVIFYFLRMRFRQQPVSSTYLWRRLMSSVRGGAHLRRWSLLLLAVQIVAAMAAVFALAGPVWNARKLVKPGTVYLIDVSGSMGAQDGSRARLAAARATLRRELAKQDRDSPGVIFACAGRAEQIGGPTADRRKLEGWAGTLRAGNLGFNELAVAEDLRVWLAAEQRPWQACLLTDGGLDQQGRQLSETFGGALRSLTVGVAGGNIGVSALRIIGRKAQFTIFSSWTVTRTVHVILEKDGRRIAEDDPQAAPGGQLASMPLGAAEKLGRSYMVSVQSAGDRLPLDDRAYLVTGSARRVKVLLAGAYNPFLHAALSSPGVAVTEWKKLPSKDFNGSAWDLVVVDQVKIPTAIHTNLLAFGSLPAGGPVKMGGDIQGLLTREDTTHPLLRFVGFQGVHVAKGRELKADNMTQVLARVAGKPILVAWEKGGWSNVVFGGTLLSSDLGLSGDFPIFLRNLAYLCVPQANNPLAGNLTTGERTILAQAPGWRIETGSVDMERHGPMVSLYAKEPGFFRWSHGAEEGIMAANPPASESEIAPRKLPLKAAAVKIAAKSNTKRIPLELIPMILLLTALSLEWLMWRGGWIVVTPASRHNGNRE